MLKGIPAGITPELLKVLDEMGHGDVLVIGDSNFPATSIANAKNHINIRLDGRKGIETLDDVLKLYPLDDFIDKPVWIMQKTEKHKDMDCKIHKEFAECIAKYDARGDKCIEFLERFDFYEKAKDAYAVVSTTEIQPYACIMLQKGCV